MMSVTCTCPHFTAGETGAGTSLPAVQLVDGVSQVQPTSTVTLTLSVQVWQVSIIRGRLWLIKRTTIFGRTCLGTL